MTLNKRLDKIEHLLTPKQAVILWLQETQQYRNAEEYTQFLRGQPESARPLYKITKQISQTTRQSMKDRPKEVVEDAVNRGVRDVCFLIKLHHQVNAYQMTEERVWSIVFAYLQSNLRAITWQNSYFRLLSDMPSIYSRVIPYPLDPETAAAVKSAIQNDVTIWEDFDNGDYLDEWFYTYLLDQGAREIPEGAFTFVEGKFKPQVTAENEKEVRDCFKDDIEFERFKTGEDYTNLLSTVKDADYAAHYDQMVKAIHQLVDSGDVKAGSSVWLETVPIPFLQLATLIDGEWLDRHVLVLAEVGAIAAGKGYQIKKIYDEHPLAWPRFLDVSGNDVDYAEIGNLCKQADRHLKKFPGRIKEIDGRPYLNFEDYCSWRGRKVKENLRSCVSAGFLTASWNAWIDAKGEKATMAEVPVHRLEYWLEEQDYMVCPDGIEERLKRRESQLNVMGSARLEQMNGDADFWKQMAGASLTNLYAFRQAVATIRQRYFDGTELLFPDLDQSLANLTKHTEELVNTFNDQVIKKSEDKINIEVLRQDTDKITAERVSYLVDMSKAEALDAMGENRAAVELVERHLEN
jgi:hypothetical protein